MKSVLLLYPWYFNGERAILNKGSFVSVSQTHERVVVKSVISLMCQIEAKMKLIIWCFPLPIHSILCHFQQNTCSEGLLREATRPHKLMTLVSSLSGFPGQLNNSYDKVHLLQFPPMITVSEGVREGHLLFFSLLYFCCLLCSHRAVMAVTHTTRLRGRRQLHRAKRNKLGWWQWR